MFKIGQRVWDMRYGWGYVKDTQGDVTNYPIEVHFDCNEDINYYNEEGREYIGNGRTLFFTEIPIPEHALIPPKEEIVLKQGDVILFKDGSFGCVEKNSGANEQTFSYYLNLPRSLEDAYNSYFVKKIAISKVIGNVND